MKRSAYNPDQGLLPGVISESDVVRDYMRKIGRKGGKAGTPAQLAHRKAVMEKVNARKRLNAQQRGDKVFCPHCDNSYVITSAGLRAFWSHLTCYHSYSSDLAYAKVGDCVEDDSWDKD